MPVELIELLCIILVPIVTYLMYLLVFMLFYWIKILKSRQKTRSTQQRRMYAGNRARQLSMQGEPTIYVSPANLPPPPKYEAMAPPSYDEVMGIQYPGYQSGQQPITQPITHAMAHGSSTDIPGVHTVNTTNTPRSNEIATDAPAVVTVSNEQRRTSIAVRA
ncbi:uncharacterized protein LOC135083489 isoform X6 [Ostrinia nubilalis]|uniref:uncharacterized protein LOC135083489 isoform X6 n=1 Tax=Ostrinia nubilalis TaxID=29057 RepID=UPI0030824D94